MKTILTVLLIMSSLSIFANEACEQGIKDLSLVGYQTGESLAKGEYVDISPEKRVEEINHAAELCLNEENEGCVKALSSVYDKAWNQGYTLEQGTDYVDFEELVDAIAAAEKACL
jgi:hypothetical protein